MHGLRKINNTYTPDGTGRDLLIYYDASFRGGKQCNDRFSPHLPKPEAGEVKLGRARRTGYDARIEASSQHLNLSSSMGNLLSTKKLAHACPYATRLDELRSLSETRASSTLFRSRSDPGLLGNCPFRRSVGAAHAGTMAMSMTQVPKPTGPEAPGATATKAKTEVWIEPGERHQYMGFSRTAYGGLWKAMSATGPG